MAEAIARANEMLRAEAGASADQVQGCWSFTQDERGRNVLDLALTYDVGSASARFVRSELTDAYRLERRLYRLWGDVLKDLTEKRLAKVRDA